MLQDPVLLGEDKALPGTMGEKPDALPTATAFKVGKHTGEVPQMLQGLSAHFFPPEPVLVGKCTPSTV